jgi:cholinesterase
MVSDRWYELETNWSYSDCGAAVQDPTIAVGMDVNPNPLLLLTNFIQLGRPMSEDCLTLNIWTKPQSDSKAKAVLFWVYGGGMILQLSISIRVLIPSGFATGNSANPTYDGQHITDSQDVIVVSIK